MYRENNKGPRTVPWGTPDKSGAQSDRQHAFRKRHSCETQLTTVINDWAKVLDSRGQVDAFMLDFEKAFDTPPHELLKSKLFSYGIGSKTLKWMDSFLCFRQLRVIVNGVKSTYHNCHNELPCDYLGQCHCKDHSQFYS